MKKVLDHLMAHDEIDEITTEQYRTLPQQEWAVVGMKLLNYGLQMISTSDSKKSPEQAALLLALAQVKTIQGLKVAHTEFAGQNGITHDVFSSGALTRCYGGRDDLKEAKRTVSVVGSILAKHAENMEPEATDDSKQLTAS